jgi:hypothetical protein
MIRSLHTKEDRILMGTRFATAAVSLALLAAPAALAAGGATVKTTPKSATVGQKVKMLVEGMKPNEKVKAHELAPYGQTRNLYPRAGKGGALLVTVPAQVKGKHTWTFTGRDSKRSVQTSYYVK